jgi:prophage regulatory protein
MNHDEVFDRFLDRHELRAIIPMHPTHLARLERAGEFPRRVKLGRSRVAWSLYEVLMWMEARKAERQ